MSRLDGERAVIVPNKYLSSRVAGGRGSSGFRESKVDAQKLYENFNQLSIGNNIPSLDESESGRRCKSLEFLSIYINFQLDEYWNNLI